MTKRHIAHIIIEADTPIKVGSNAMDFLNDSPVQRDWNGLPMILGTSIAGVLRKEFDPMITAPYNFVPLNKEVFYPSWSEQVSHDIPFEDGESGEIEITITAKSPIFIRDHENSEEFCQHNGEYYIPSTSIKGMVRNVLEIMSFGEMRIDEKKLSQPMTVRDMSNSKELVGVATGCGFLKQDTQGKWFIEDYGQPRTIEYTDTANKTLTIDNKTYTFTTGHNDENMSAQEKYELLGNHYFNITIKTGLEDLYNRDGKK